MVSRRDHGQSLKKAVKKITTVIKWIKEAFKQYDDMSFEKQQEFKNLALKLASDTATSNTAKSATKKVVEKAVDKNVTKNTASNGSLLDSLIAKFKKQNTDKMLSLEDKELGSLTKTQIETLKAYTGSSYVSFNAYLRQKAAGEAYTGHLSKDSIDELEDAVKAFSKIKAKEDYVLRRGTDSDDIVYTFLNGDKSMREKMQNLIYDIEGDLFGPGGKIDEAKLQEHIGEINSLVKGQLGSFGSFTSTSSDWGKGFNGDVEYVIDAPKGTAGTSVMSISKYGTSEGEFLLAPGTKVICEKVEAARDGHKRALVRVFIKVIV